MTFAVDVDIIPVMDNSNELHTRLRQARERAGLSAREVATQLGRAESAIRNQENGTNGVPLQLIPQYASLYGVRPEWLAWGVGQEPEAGWSGITLTVAGGANSGRSLLARVLISAIAAATPESHVSLDPETAGMLARGFDPVEDRKRLAELAPNVRLREEVAR